MSLNCAVDPERMLVLVHVSAAGHRLLRERPIGTKPMSKVVTVMSVSGRRNSPCK